MRRAKKHHDDKKYRNPDFSDIHSEGEWGFFFGCLLFFIRFCTFGSCFSLFRIGSFFFFSFENVYKNRGFLQTRQLHWGQHSSFFLQSQLSITDITESISDITE